MLKCAAGLFYLHLCLVEGGMGESWLCDINLVRRLEECEFDTYQRHGGSVVSSVPCVRRVIGSNPILAAM